MRVGNVMDYGSDFKFKQFPPGRTEMQKKNLLSYAVNEPKIIDTHLTNYRDVLYFFWRLNNPLHSREEDSSIDLAIYPYSLVELKEKIYFLPHKARILIIIPSE